MNSRTGREHTLYARSMHAGFSIAVPADFQLARDVCSYGYFLLCPNAWDPSSSTFWRVLDVGTKPAVLVWVSHTNPGGPLRVRTSRTTVASERESIRAQLTRMLWLDMPPTVSREFHRRDPRWRAAGRCRLFRSPSLFEDVIKTVTSCNVTWPSTVVMNRRLCEVVGTRVPLPVVKKARKADSVRQVFTPEAFTFPTPSALARQRPARLRALCRVGYRDARIIELARLFALPVSRGGVDQAMLTDPSTSDERVREALLELPGVGPYAAANILQLLGRYAHLPLDTESVRHGKSVLGMKGSSPAVMKQIAAHYKPFGPHRFRSYWFEMWREYESKHGKAWTWERTTTGRLFTAALLNK